MTTTQVEPCQAPAAAPPRRRFSELRSTHHRVRRQLMPPKVMAALWSTASLTYLLPVDAWLASAIYAGGALVWWLGWGWRRVQKGRRRQGAVSTLAGGAWFVAASQLGTLGWSAATLLVGGCVMAASYWRRNRLPVPPAVRPPPPVLIEAGPSRDQQMYAERVADGGDLAGSVLTDPEPIKGGTRYTAELVPGKQTFGTLLIHQRKIASALERTRDDVVVEQHASRIESKGTVLVMRENPLLETLPWSGPSYDPRTGRVTIGAYTDGTPAQYRVHDRGSGLWGGGVIGGTGAGKSRLLESLGASLHHSGLYVVWTWDGKGGSSLPNLAEHADWAADSYDEALRMMLAAERIIAWRSKWNSLQRISHFDPTPDRPGLYIFADEIHKWLRKQNDPLVRACSNVSREGRSLGVQVIYSDQYPGLDSWGRDEALRSSAWVGNNLVMRTASKSSRGIIPGLAIDPYEIPEIPGYGYTVGGEEGGRTAPYRAEYLVRPETAFNGGQQPALEDVARGAAGEDYRDRHARRQAERTALAAEFASFAMGAVLPTIAELVGRVDDRELATVISISDRPAPPSDGGAIDRVLHLIRAGVDRNKDIAAVSGYSVTWVGVMLDQLKASGRVTKAHKQAPWQVVESREAVS